MRDFVLLPEALVVVGAVSVMLAGRFGWLPRGWRSFLPQAMSFLVLVALVVELWTGAALTSFFGGAVVQDRFALFAKAAVLLTTAVVLAATDWSAEDSLHLGLAMPMLAAFAVMVAASSANLLALWAGLELAAACGVVIVSLRRPDLGLRLLLAGGVASALILVGLAFLYATTGNADRLPSRCCSWSPAWRCAPAWRRSTSPTCRWAWLPRRSAPGSCSALWRWLRAWWP